MGHVVAVAYPADLHALVSALLLYDSEDIRQPRARVVRVGQAVYDGDCRVLRVLLNCPVSECPDDDCVDIPGHDARRVLYRLSAATRGVPLADEYRVPPELVHGCLQRYACAGRGLLEY